MKKIKWTSSDIDYVESIAESIARNEILRREAEIRAERKEEEERRARYINCDVSESPWRKAAKFNNCESNCDLCIHSKTVKKSFHEKIKREIERDRIRGNCMFAGLLDNTGDSYFCLGNPKICLTCEHSKQYQEILKKQRETKKKASRKKQTGSKK